MGDDDADRWATSVLGPQAVVVELSEYDPRWPEYFAAERDRIVAALGERELAGREYADVNVYADAKGPTIFAILREAGWTPPGAD